VVGEVIAGRYELEELCGTGGMSSVFRAHDALLDRTVALKILHEQYSRDDDYVERFRHEARAVAQLAHPNIVTVIDRGEQDGRQFIVFEFVDGENLKELVERRGPLPVREAIELALQTARALAFAHTNGLVHRDVNDFGIARSLDVQHGLTQTGTVLGTSNYIAPEQARGERVDALSDVYSLGCVLYELLTGEVPFDGENFVSVAMRHINEPAPSVLDHRPDVPLRLDSAVRRAMAKHPSERFDSMDDFVAELQACLAELAAPDADPTMIVQSPVLRQGPKRVSRRGGRRRTWPVVLLLVALAAVAAVVAAIVLIGRSSGTDAASNDGGGTPATPTAAAVKLRAVASYDPTSDGGDGTEHDSDVPKATDRNPETAWTTEHYQSFSKRGVGIVFDAGSPVSLKQLTVTTTTPGMVAQVESGDSTTGPFVPDSASRTIQPKQTIDLQGKKARYYLLWITKLAGDQASVNEVTAGR
jgi:eukaryotic-like serine/threonine-protein kinase